VHDLVWDELAQDLPGLRDMLPEQLGQFSRAFGQLTLDLLSLDARQFRNTVSLVELLSQRLLPSLVLMEVGEHCLRCLARPDGFDQMDEPRIAGR
jgi:hypothetical protein